MGTNTTTSLPQTASNTITQRLGTHSTVVIITGVFEEHIGSYPGATVVRDVRANKKGQHYIAIWTPAFDKIKAENPDANPMELKALMLQTIEGEKSKREAAREAARQEREQEANATPS